MTLANNLLRKLLRRKYELRNKYRENEMKILQLQSENSRIFQDMESLVMSVQAYYSETKKSVNANAQRLRS